MASGNAVASYHSTLTTTAADTVKLTQFWDAIEIENKDTAVLMYVTFNATTPTSGAAGSFMVPPETSKVFRGGTLRGDGVAGNTTTPPHEIRLVGNANAYGVEGIAGNL